MPKLYIAFYKVQDFGLVWCYEYCKILFRDDVNEVGVVMRPVVGIDMYVRNSNDGDIEFSSNYDVFVIEVSNEELKRIFHMCTTMKQMNVSYSTSYLLRSYLFTVEDNAINVNKIKSLHNAQFVVVVLRECLDSSRSLTALLRSLNSATTTPTILFGKLVL